MIYKYHYYGTTTNGYITSAEVWRQTYSYQNLHIIYLFLILQIAIITTAITKISKTPPTSEPTRIYAEIQINTHNIISFTISPHIFRTIKESSPQLQVNRYIILQDLYLNFFLGDSNLLRSSSSPPCLACVMAVDVDVLGSFVTSCPDAGVVVLGVTTRLVAVLLRVSSSISDAPDQQRTVMLRCSSLPGTKFNEN